MQNLAAFTVCEMYDNKLNMVRFTALVLASKTPLSYPNNCVILFTSQSISI